MFKDLQAYFKLKLSTSKQISLICVVFYIQKAYSDNKSITKLTGADRLQ